MHPPTLKRSLMCVLMFESACRLAHDRPATRVRANRTIRAPTGSATSVRRANCQERTNMTANDATTSRARC